MSDEPSGRDTLFLWRLALAGGGDWKKDVKPLMDAKDRKRLIKLGLLDERKESPTGKGRKVLYFALTDQAWGWLAERMQSPITTRSPASLEILTRLLARLGGHLNRTGVSLGEFLADEEAPPRQKSCSPRIEAACRQLNAGRPESRVRLADLRRTIGDIPRGTLDEALLQMAIAGSVRLYPLDNPMEIKAEDREAVLLTPSG